MPTALPLLLALVVAPATGASLPPRAALEPEAIVLDLSRLDPLDPQIRDELAGAIRQRAAALASKYALPPAAIHVSIGWRDAAAFDYALRVEIAAHDGLPARTDARATGPDTEQGELAIVVEAALERLLAARVRAQAPRPVAADAAPHPSPPPPRRAPSPRLGAMGWSGVGVAIAGFAAMGAGVALMVIAPTAHPTDPTKLRSWRPGGIALLACGGAALLGGGAVAGVDGARRVQQRRRAALGAWGSRRSAGVTVRVSF